MENKDPKAQITSTGFAVKTSSDVVVAVFVDKGSAESYCHSHNLDVKRIGEVRFAYNFVMPYTGVRG